MYPAKKVAGERLDVAAGEDGEVERQPVPITVAAMELLELRPPKEDGTRDFVMRVRCSSGTYVRTLAADIGARLGAGAHLSALRRTAVGDFRVEDALTLDEVLRRGDEGSLEQSLIAPAAVLGHLPM